MATREDFAFVHDNARVEWVGKQASDRVFGEGCLSGLVLGAVALIVYHPRNLAIGTKLGRILLESELDSFGLLGIEFQRPLVNPAITERHVAVPIATFTRNVMAPVRGLYSATPAESGPRKSSELSISTIVLPTAARSSYNLSR